MILTPQPNNYKLQVVLMSACNCHQTCKKKSTQYHALQTFTSFCRPKAKYI